MQKNNNNNKQLALSTLESVFNVVFTGSYIGWIIQQILDNVFLSIILKDAHDLFGLQFPHHCMIECGSFGTVPMATYSVGVWIGSLGVRSGSVNFLACFRLSS